MQEIANDAVAGRLPLLPRPRPRRPATKNSLSQFFAVWPRRCTGSSGKARLPVRPQSASPGLAAKPSSLDCIEVRTSAGLGCAVARSP